MRRTVCGFAWVLLIAACRDATIPGVPPNVGSVTVSVTTAGQDPDSDGYYISVDGGSETAIAPNESITLRDVPEGTREVRLRGLAENCTTVALRQSVSVVAGQSVAVAYVITCAARVGNIIVTIATIGGDLPTDYRLGVDDDAGRPVGTNETTALVGIREGAHRVSLRDLPENCAADGSNPSTVSVEFGQTARVAFAITCNARTGAFIDVSAGGNHTCANSAAGSLYCWGINSLGQLGDGTTTIRLAPTLVRSAVSFAQVSAAAGYTCARTAAGATYCWGNNLVGQLGDDTRISRPLPGLVGGTLRFAEVSANRYGDGLDEDENKGHTCARTDTGAVYCWGVNWSGQLGDGTTTDRLLPTAIAGGLRFADVSVGGGRTCGVTESGAVYCWGNNLIGQVGGVTDQYLTVPSQVIANVGLAKSKHRGVTPAA